MGLKEASLARKSNSPDQVKKPPFETHDLRQRLAEFLDVPYPDAEGEPQKIGNFRWGVYAFFDYDGEPIYVGQTNELVRTRIRRHLTNQRTDAVAMSVLDPFEVYSIRVHPLPQYQEVTKNRVSKEQFEAAKHHLNKLERAVYDRAVADSKFGAVLNEKDPPVVEADVDIPEACEGVIVSKDVFAIRSHPDFRISRRALIISRLAQVIAERKVQGGLRRVLITQAKDSNGSPSVGTRHWEALRLLRPRLRGRKKTTTRRTTKKGTMTRPTSERSRIMRAVRDRDTKPEMLVRKMVHRLGYRYRLHRADLPGKPDLVFPSRRKVIFVNGCFWHGHDCKRGARTPKTNTDYWINKVARNLDRDSANLKELRMIGWRPLVIWECELKDSSKLKQRLRRFLS